MIQLLEMFIFLLLYNGQLLIDDLPLSLSLSSVPTAYIIKLKLFSLGILKFIVFTLCVGYVNKRYI